MSKLLQAKRAERQKRWDDLLEAERVHLLDKVLAVVKRIALEPPEEHSRLFYIYAYGKKGSDYKDPFLQNRALADFTKLDRRVIDAYSALLRPNRPMHAGELVYWQKEVKEIGAVGNKPYDKRYQCALQLHVAWLEAKSWEQFKKNELMTKLADKDCLNAKTDWYAERRLSEKTAADLVTDICGTEALSPKTIRQWRKRWANFGYWDPASGYLQNGRR